MKERDRIVTTAADDRRRCTAEDEDGEKQSAPCDLGDGGADGLTLWTVGIS